MTAARHVQQGFRAPNPAEIGDAGSTSGFVGNLWDPVYAPGGPASTAARSRTCRPACSILCNIVLQEPQLSAPHLKPEKSTSFTVGTIFEPKRKT